LSGSGKFEPEHSLGQLIFHDPYIRSEFKMSHIILLGLSHKSAPVEIRERLSFSSDETLLALETLQKETAINEVILLSTCNRVEILITAENKKEAVDAVKAYISRIKNIPNGSFEEQLYIHYGDDAVRHIFRVASSLDSMVVGEPQILGQLKEAYQNATTQKASGVILNRLLHRTFFVAKRVRSETGIGDSAVSISYAAVELARKIFGNLDKKTVLLIGAGEMAELAVEHLIRNRVGDILVANRTFERGVDLAETFKGKAVKMEEIPDTLTHADIIISSTGAPGFVLTSDQIKSIMRTRRNRPLFFIDIAVPRDIDPEINSLNNSYVYDIDDLKGVIDENIEERKKEAIKGERIIDEAVIRFRQWYENLDIVPTIVGLRNKLDNIARSEVEKTVQSLKHLSEEDTQAIYRMTDAIVNKMLHYPTQHLKNSNRHGNKSIHIDIARRLFKLDD